VRFSKSWVTPAGIRINVPDSASMYWSTHEQRHRSLDDVEKLLVGLVGMSARTRLAWTDPPDRYRIPVATLLAIGEEYALHRAAIVVTALAGAESDDSCW
jgi:hypothetical protein